MLHNPCKTLGYKKKYGLRNSSMGGGGGVKPYPASGLVRLGIEELLFQESPMVMCCVHGQNTEQISTA